MFKNFLKKSNRIEFTVLGKPPKKTVGSMWSENSNQIQLVLDLRKNAYEAIKKTKLNELFSGPVKFTLTVYAPNILIRKDRYDYLGDIDSLIGGVFEALQSAPNNPDLKIHPLLKNVENIGSDVPLIVSDDAQVTTAIGKKIKSTGDTSYHVLIESDVPHII